MINDALSSLWWNMDEWFHDINEDKREWEKENFHFPWIKKLISFTIFFFAIFCHFSLENWLLIVSKIDYCRSLHTIENAKETKIRNSLIKWVRNIPICVFTPNKNYNNIDYVITNVLYFEY